MFLVILLTLTALCNNVELVLVRVEQGLLRGELRDRSTGNGQLCSFKGIPYAAPPVGHLRFKAPQPALPWKGEKNATVHGAVCPQVETRKGQYIFGSEDCLFLNVYTPTTNFKASLPVMVYIGGEGFVSGSGDEDYFGPDFILDNNVILVTMNYRVGALGFLCLHTKEAPGNAGLKDQAAALRWIKKNIARFGGDPKTVTIFGQSSGGSSVTLHTFSPMSKGLFKRAIGMSRVSFNDNVFEPRRQGMLLAHRLGFYTEDPYKAFRFLQNASVEAIVTARPCVLGIYEQIEHILKYLTFPPVVEKRFGDEHFLLEHPEQMLLKGNMNKIELILGHTAMEGITRGVSQKDYSFEIFPYFKEVLVPTWIGLPANRREVLKLGDQIQNHYFGCNEISERNMKDFIKFYTYFVYVHNIHRFLEMWVKTSNKVYFYKFSCYSERNVHGKTGEKYGLKEASHFDDLMYLFDGKKYNITLDKTKPSYKMIKQTCALFTNFAKYGNPTPDKSLGVTWQHYNRDQTYLDIDLELTQHRANLSEIDFWRHLYESAGRRFS